jgi:hypothetical protein
MELKEFVKKYQIAVCQDGKDRKIRADSSIARCPSDIEYLKSHKAEIISLIMEEAERKKMKKERIPIVCWYGCEWVVGIRIQKKFTKEFRLPNVFQNDEPLEQYDGINVSDNVYFYWAYYAFQQLKGKVEVVWNSEDKQEIEIPKYLIFKLKKNDFMGGVGRLVSHSITGCCLVIAPYEWKRDNEISGAEFTVPEQVHIEGYNAHFFDLNQNKSIAFIDGNDERIQLQ